MPRIRHRIFQFFITAVTLVEWISNPLALAHTNGTQETKEIKYTVQPGETISDIAWERFDVRPIYGKHGFVKKLLELNPHLKKYNGNYVHSGETIILYVPLTANFQPPSKNLVASSRVPAESKKVEATPRQEKVYEVDTELPAPIEPSPPSPIKPLLQDESLANSGFEVRLGGHYSGLYGTEKANGSRATLLSDLSPSFRGSWKQFWDEEQFSEIYVLLQSVRFIPTETTRQIINDSAPNSALGISYATKLSPRLMTKLDLEVAKTFFYIGTASGALEVNQVPLLRVHPSVEYQLVSKRPLSLTGILGASYFGGSSYQNYSISAGTGFDFALKATHKRKKSEFSCQFEYTQRQQNTTYLEFGEKLLGASCGLSWKFDEE